MSMGTGQWGGSARGGFDMDEDCIEPEMMGFGGGGGGGRQLCEVYDFALPEEDKKPSAAVAAKKPAAVKAKAAPSAAAKKKAAAPVAMAEGGNVSEASIDSWDVSEDSSSDDGERSNSDSQQYDYEEEDGDEFDTLEDDMRKEYAVLSAEQMNEQRAVELERVCCELGLGASAASAILRKYKWDVRALRKEWDADSLAVFEKSGIQFDTEESFKTLPAEERKCQVCMETRSDKFYSLGCSHEFCHECWEGHITCSIESGEVSGLVCMADKCHLVVPKDFIALNLKDEGALMEKYERFVGESWVKQQSGVKFCPRPDCECAVDGRKSGIKDRDPPVTVKCSCDFKFCFTCTLEAHQPAVCKEVEKWNDKFQNDEESQKYLKLHVKQCPTDKGCGRMIKKEGGCNHIWNCPCGFHWCWVCQQAWEVR